MPQTMNANTIDGSTQTLAFPAKQAPVEFMFPMTKATYVISREAIITDQIPEPISLTKQHSTHADFYVEQTNPLDDETSSISSNTYFDPRLIGLDLGYYPKRIPPDQLRVLMDADTRDFCQRKELLSDIESINDIIRNNNQGVHHVDLGLIQDPEVPGHEKLCFEIHLVSEPDQVLDDEDDFYDDFFSKIPQGKRDFFVFIYQVS